jgi:hypothetical protein
MGRGKGEVTPFCPHSERPGGICNQCVILMGMALGTLDNSVVMTIVSLADAYALQIIEDLPSVLDEEDLRDGLSGAFLSFMAEAIMLAHGQSIESSHSLRG